LFSSVGFGVLSNGRAYRFRCSCAALSKFARFEPTTYSFKNDEGREVHPKFQILDIRPRRVDHCCKISFQPLHDEQQQFGKHLREVFEVSKMFSDIDASSPLAQLLNLKQMTTFNCEFRMVNSRNSFGLQVLDLALWIKRRYADNPGSVRGKCLELAHFIDEHGFKSQFTTDSMRGEVLRGFQVIKSGPAVSVEQERKARQALSEIENMRLERMHTVA
jgi:hypothetical protein